MIARYTKPILLLLFVFAAGTAWAQSLRIGARVLPQINGLYNSQDVSNRDYITSVPTVGFSGGLAVSYQIGSQWGIEVNMLYAVQGQNYNGNSRLTITQRVGAPVGVNDTTVNSYLHFRLPTPNLNTGQGAQYSISMSLIKLPILFTYNSKNTTGPVFRAYAGPQLAFLFDVQERITFADQSAATNNTRSTQQTNPINYAGTGFSAATDRYNGLDISLVLGAGYDFKLTDKLYLNTSLRTEFGLLDVERKRVFWSIPDGSPLPIPAGVARLEDFYGNYYGVGRARTAATRSFAVSFVLGVTYVLSNKRNPKDYYW
jgi:hypothetical protein